MPRTATKRIELPELRNGEWYAFEPAYVMRGNNPKTGPYTEEYLVVECRHPVIGTRTCNAYLVRGIPVGKKTYERFQLWLRPGIQFEQIPRAEAERRIAIQRNT